MRLGGLACSLVHGSLVRCCHRLSSTALRVGAGSRCTRRIHDRGSMGAFAYDGPAHGPAAGARLGSGISVGPPRSPRTPTQPAPHRCRPTTGSDPRDDLWYMCSTCAVHVQYEGERYAPNYSYTSLTVLAQRWNGMDGSRVVVCFIWFSASGSPYALLLVLLWSWAACALRSAAGRTF